MEKQISKNYPHLEKKFAWAGVIVVLLIFTLLHGYLASKFSLWGDEFDAIAPALRPWKGEHNFWWQIRQYIANPPGENLVLRLYYKSEWLAWLRESSPELFWRIPYILVFALTSLATYFFAEKWSKSPLIATLAFAFFVSSPGPFAWATEVRFYGWAMFFMTCAVWQGIFFIEKSDFVSGKYSRRDFAWLSGISALGICFHVSMALVCYLLFWFALWVFASEVWKWKKAAKKIDRRELIDVATLVFLGLLPYFVFKHAKHHWMFVPGGLGYGAVFKESVSHWFQITPGQFEALLPFSNFGRWFFFLTIILMAGFAVYGIFKRKITGIIVAVFLVALLVGGSLVITFSSHANRFSILPRHYLFVFPVIVAIWSYLIGKLFNSLTNRPLPRVRAVAAVLTLALALSSGVFLARNNFKNGSPAKVNYDLAGFRDFYRQLPDRRKLILVGVGDGELWALTDDGGYIGGIHMPYTREFSPEYLNIRVQPSPELIEANIKWKSYDLLIFSGGEKILKQSGFDSLKFSCRTFKGEPIRFCRN